MMKKIIGYKGFNSNMQCFGFQYEVGKTYHHEGEIIPCKSGFHACEYPLDVFNYYNPSDSLFARVEQSGEIEKDHSFDSKTVSSSIRVVETLDLSDLINAAVSYTKNRCDFSEMGSINSSKNGVAINWDFGYTATNNGERGAATNTGIIGAATNSGENGAASNNGYKGAATNSGVRGAATNSGDRGAATNSGYEGAASNDGYEGAATNTGTSGAASNRGYAGAATNSGHRGTAINSGDRGAAINNAYNGTAINSGKNGIAASFGGFSKAKSEITGAIVLVNYDDCGKIRHIRASKVGENGIKPNVYYTLDENGEFREAS